MTKELSTERAIEALYTVRAYYASLTAGYPKGKDCRGIGDVMCSEIANSCLMAIKALEQQPNRCDSCTHSEEQDGSNCYECIKGMADNFEAQPTDADCISRQAVIKHICESKECYKDECKGRLYKRCYDLQWIYDLPSVTPQQTRWIPVSDGLPENRMFCLMTVEIMPYGCNSTYEVHTAWFDGRNFIDKVSTDNIIAKRSVVAWMPLPEPYKAQKKECADCKHYGKLSLDCGRCDDNCSMFASQESEE